MNWNKWFKAQEAKNLWDYKYARSSQKTNGVLWTETNNYQLPMIKLVERLEPTH